jgi:hypothetical protein
MGCGCPEPAPVPNGCNYIIYSGGPIENVYRLVEHAIPADAELTHGRPTVCTDGSLEFAGDPPILSGYRREGLRLCPIWPPCALRMLKVQVLDNQLAVDGMCGNPKTEHFGHEVTLEQCQECSVRQSPSV